VPVVHHGILEAMRRLSLRCVLVGVMAAGLAACSNDNAHKPTAAVVTTCEAALTASNPSPSEVAFVQIEAVKRAEASGGSVFAHVVEKWIASTDPIERIAAAKAVVRECDRLGGFPSA